MMDLLVFIGGIEMCLARAVLPGGSSYGESDDDKRPVQAGREEHSLLVRNQV
jgi:hypothetical protein